MTTSVIDTAPRLPISTEIEQRASDWIAPYSQAWHLVRARDWVVHLDPGASLEVRLAVLTHDIERMFPNGPSLDKGTCRWDDPRLPLRPRLPVRRSGGCLAARAGCSRRGGRSLASCSASSRCTSSAASTAPTSCRPVTRCRSSKRSKTSSATGFSPASATPPRLGRSTSTWQIASASRKPGAWPSRSSKRRWRALTPSKRTSTAQGRRHCSCRDQPRGIEGAHGLTSDSLWHSGAQGPHAESRRSPWALSSLRSARRSGDSFGHAA